MPCRDVSAVSACSVRAVLVRAYQHAICFALTRRAVLPALFPYGKIAAAIAIEADARRALPSNFPRRLAILLFALVAHAFSCGFLPFTDSASGSGSPPRSVSIYDP